MPEDESIDAAGFPATHWTQLRQLPAGDEEQRLAILNDLIERYWRPVYGYIVHRGNRSQDAEDLAQGFFAHCLRNNVFAQARPERGKFRALLLQALKNFLANAHRDANAKKRQPEGGLVSIHALVVEQRENLLPTDEAGDPDAAFNQEWFRALLLRAFERFAEVCEQKEQTLRLELVRRRFVEPYLNNSEEPVVSRLGESMGIDAATTNRAMYKAREAFRKHLGGEIREYAESEAEVFSEMREMIPALRSL